MLGQASENKCNEYVLALFTGFAHPFYFDAQGGRFAQQFDEYHGAVFAIGHLIDAFDAREGAFGQQDALALLEQAFRCVLPHAFVGFQQGDQLVVRLGGVVSEAHQGTDAFGRADRSPAFVRCVRPEADEQVAWKQGDVDDCELAPAQLFGGKTRQIALVALPFEIFQRVFFQAGFGLDEIPVHAFFRRIVRRIL